MLSGTFKFRHHHHHVICSLNENSVMNCMAWKWRLACTVHWRGLTDPLVIVPARAMCLTHQDAFILLALFSVGIKTSFFSGFFFFPFCGLVWSLLVTALWDIQPVPRTPKSPVSSCIVLWQTDGFLHLFCCILFSLPCFLCGLRTSRPWL